MERSSGDEVLQGTPRSRMTKTPLPYVSKEPIPYPFSIAINIDSCLYICKLLSVDGRAVVVQY